MSCAPALKTHIWSLRTICTHKVNATYSIYKILKKIKKLKIKSFRAAILSVDLKLSF